MCKNWVKTAEPNWHARKCNLQWKSKSFSCLFPSHTKTLVNEVFHVFKAKTILKVKLYKEKIQSYWEKKYESSYKVPFKVLKVNDNGTVCLRVGAVEDNVNIRRLTPYTQANAINHGGECSMHTFKSSRRQK